MAVSTDKNTAYGPPLVNQKYAPLQNIQWVAGDQALYSGMLNLRRNALVNANYLPRTLGLASRNWVNIDADEATAGRQPPLVIVSSNRSGWIRDGLAAVNAQIAGLNVAAGHFNGPSDYRALAANAGQLQGSPIYTPLRQGAPLPLNRGIYVVVHSSEYTRYRDRLDPIGAPTGIKVIGWDFQRNPGQNERVVGFGASRYAAMEFCKDLQANHGAVWNKAWLIDDNVVFVTNFPGWNLIEQAMNVAPVSAAGGFMGGTLAEAFLTVRNFARQNINLAPPGAVVAPGPANIIQQLSCWNVDMFVNNHRNFGPVFMNSAEDLSITNLFIQQGIPYRHWQNMHVWKETTTYDGANTVGNARRSLAAWITGLESAAAGAPGAPPPPPIDVQPAQAVDGGVQLLSTFVTTRVLPHSSLHAQALNVDVQNEAKAHGVEQITCGAILRGWISPLARQQTFQLNGAAGAQVINRANV